MDGTVVLSFRLPVWCSLFGHFSCSCLLSKVGHTVDALHQHQPPPPPPYFVPVLRPHTLHPFAHQQRIASLRLKTPLQYAQTQSTPYHTLHHTNESVYFPFHNATQRDKHILTNAHTRTHIETRTVQFACFFHWLTLLGTLILQFLSLWK